MMKKLLYFSLFTILIMLGIVSIRCGKIGPHLPLWFYPFQGTVLGESSVVIDLQANKVYQGKKKVYAWADKHIKKMFKQNKIATTLVGIDAIDWFARHDYLIQKKIEMFFDGIFSPLQGTSILTPSRQSIIVLDLIPLGNVLFSTDDKGIIANCVLNYHSIWIHTDDCIIQMYSGHAIRVTFYVDTSD